MNGHNVRSCVHRRDAEGAERTQSIVEILNKAPLRFLCALGVSAVKSSRCARLKYNHVRRGHAQIGRLRDVPEEQSKMSTYHARITVTSLPDGARTVSVTVR